MNRKRFMKGECLWCGKYKRVRYILFHLNLDISQTTYPEIFCSNKCLEAFIKKVEKRKK